jgi:prophage regulatory protein
MRLIRKPELRKLVPYSDFHVWRLEQEGKFSKRIKLGPNSVAWAESEVNDWIKAKMAARDGEAA